MKLIVFSGLPGTGKSTLANRLGIAIAAPVFSHDWLKGALKLSLKNFDSLDAARGVGKLLETLVEQQL